MFRRGLAAAVALARMLGTLPFCLFRGGALQATAGAGARGLAAVATAGTRAVVLRLLVRSHACRGAGRQKERVLACAYAMHARCGCDWAHEGSCKQPHRLFSLAYAQHLRGSFHFALLCV